MKAYDMRPFAFKRAHQQNSTPSTVPPDRFIMRFQTRWITGLRNDIAFIVRYGRIMWFMGKFIIVDGRSSVQRWNCLPILWPKPQKSSYLTRTPSVILLVFRRFSRGRLFPLNN